MTNKKIIFFIALGILFLGLAIFGVYQKFFTASPTVEDCVVRLNREGIDDLVDEFNNRLREVDYSDGRVQKAITAWANYLFCRASYDFSINFYPEANSLITRLNVDETGRLKLNQAVSDEGDYLSQPFVLRLVFRDIETLCLAGKSEARTISRCVVFPDINKVAHRFNAEEVNLACSNLCQDLKRYEQNPDLFFNEQKEIKTLERFKMTDVLRMFLSIRYGGFDYAFKEIDKFSKIDDREAWRERLLSIKDLINNRSQKLQSECSKKLNDLKIAICKIKS